MKKARPGLSVELIESEMEKNTGILTTRNGF